MTGEITPTPTPSPGIDPKTYTIIIYILFGIGLMTGIFALIAIIMAYLKKDEFKNTLYHPHLVYLIRTFWAGLAIGLLGLILMIIFIGWLVWIAGYVWFIYRLVVGFINLLEGRPVSTTSWF